jgi:singapore isolate B (sub-type 7) whole genome shotgun sequence assembly, scaffold_0
MIRAQKLSGMTLAMSYYSDYSEVRFRKLLISNIDYSNFQLSDFETPSPEDPSDNTDISWNELIPKKVNVDPFLKCASSWAVAVTTYMYMKYKQADPLWTVSQNHFD